MSNNEGNIERYERACHAMQSGVKLMQNYEHPELVISDNAIEASDSPKHLRVGINTAMCDLAALVKLLVDKEIINMEDYYSSMADEMEEEVKRFEQRIKVQTGINVTLK